MPIQSGQNKGGPNGGIGKIAGLAAGIATGNPLMIAAAAAASTNTPLGRAAGLYNSANQIGDLAGKIGGGTSTPQTDQNFKQPEIGSQFQGQSPSIGGDAMTRALQTQQQSPQYLVQQGLQHLNDPAVYNSMPYDQYMGVVEPLLRAKHFGAGGGSDNGGNQ